MTKNEVNNFFELILFSKKTLDYKYEQNNDKINKVNAKDVIYSSYINTKTYFDFLHTNYWNEEVNKDFFNFLTLKMFYLYISYLDFSNYNINEMVDMFLNNKEEFSFLKPLLYEYELNKIILLKQQIDDNILMN